MDVAAFERVYESFGEFHAFFVVGAFGRRQWREHSRHYIQALLVRTTQGRRNPRRELSLRGTGTLERSGRRFEPGLGLNHLPSGRFAANGAWLAVQVLAHNLATRIGLGEQIVNPSGDASSPMAGRLRDHFASSPGLAGAGHSPWPDCEPSHSQDGAIRMPPDSRPPGPRVHPAFRSPNRLVGR